MAVLPTMQTDRMSSRGAPVSRHTLRIMRFNWSAILCCKAACFPSQAALSRLMISAPKIRCGVQFGGTGQNAAHRSGRPTPRAPWSCPGRQRPPRPPWASLGAMGKAASCEDVRAGIPGGKVVINILRQVNPAGAIAAQITSQPDARVDTRRLSENAASSSVMGAKSFPEARTLHFSTLSPAAAGRGIIRSGFPKAFKGRF